MKDLYIKGPKLTAFTTDPVFEQSVSQVANQAKARGREDIRILLEDVKFIDPYGLVSLWAIIRHLKRGFRRVRVELPDNAALQSYLRRMKFSSAVSGIATLENEISGWQGAMIPSDVLLEMTPVQRQPDLIRVTRSILGRIGQILKRELHYTARDTSAFSTIVSEVCTNIFDHSEDKGVVAAQRYIKKDGTKYAIIAAADLGIGIKASLAMRFREANTWSHLQAMVNAIQKEYSRHPERGLGLYMISKIAGDYRGSLRIRSGDSQLYVRHRAQGIPGSIFPGTQIALSLSAKGQNT